MTDAMQEAGMRLWNAAKAVALYRPLAKQICHVPSALMHELMDALIFSSAPVPPADGVQGQLPKDFGRKIETAWDIEPTPFNRADVAVRIINAEIGSGAGTAEPVATKGCIICANGNDLPEGEYCRACARMGLSAGLRAAARELSLPIQSSVRPDRKAFYTILTKYLPQDAALDALWQELREAGFVP